MVGCFVVHVERPGWLIELAYTEYLSGRQKYLRVSNFEPDTLQLKFLCGMTAASKVKRKYFPVKKYWKSQLDFPKPFQTCLPRS